MVPSSFFCDNDDVEEITQMHLPERHRIITKQTLNIPGDDFRRQLIIKLNLDLYCNQEFIWVMDSDYLLVDYISESDFMEEGRPVWLMRHWDNEPSLRWKKPSSEVLGTDIPFQFMDRLQFVFQRRALQELRKTVSLDHVLNTKDAPSEFMIYGAYCYQNMPELYKWNFVDDNKSTLSFEITQRPPSYHIVRTDIRLSEAAESKYCVFWSHWMLAEVRMLQFLSEACDRKNIGGTKFRYRLRSLIHIAQETLISRLQRSLDEIMADDSAKDELIGRLQREKAAISADSDAKDDVIRRLRVIAAG